MKISNLPKVEDVKKYRIQSRLTQKELAECIIEYDGIAVLKLPLVQKAKSLIFSNPLNLTK